MNLNSLLRASTLLGLVLLAPICVGDTSGQRLAESAGRGLDGADAPRLVLKTIDGGTIDLGALYGKKAVYVKLWATWCVPCREQMPHFEHAFETAGPDLAVIAINIGFNDSLEEVEKYRKTVGITMPIVFDEDGHVGAAFNLRVTPQHIVIGRDGRIQYVGHLADQRLDAALVAARSGGTAASVTGAGGAGKPLARQLGVGDLLPAQAVKLLGGRPFQMRDATAHRPIVLVFLSPWCETYLATTRPTVAANCRAARLQVKDRAAARDARWLGVASGLWITAADLRKYRSDYDVTIPLTLDASSGLFREFGVNDVPTLIVADGQGRIVQRVEPGDSRGLGKALDALREHAAL